MTDQQKGSQEQPQETTLEDKLRTGPITQSTAEAATPPATGPAFTLNVPGAGEVAHCRLQSIRCAGEPASPATMNNRKLRSAAAGDVSIVATATPSYAGEQEMRSAMAGRHPVELELAYVDGEKLKGHFTVDRMDHAASMSSDREYNIVLTNAEAPAKSSGE